MERVSGIKQCSATSIVKQADPVHEISDSRDVDSLILKVCETEDTCARKLTVFTISVQCATYYIRPDSSVDKQRTENPRVSGSFRLWPPLSILFIDYPNAANHYLLLLMLIVSLPQ